MGIKRYLTAIRRYHRSKGHGIHSPFAFSFVLNVLRERLPYYSYDDLREFRQKMKDSTMRHWRQPRMISLKEMKLLFRVANYFNPTEVLQLGTSYGLDCVAVLSTSSAVSLHIDTSNGDIADASRKMLSVFPNRVSFRSSVAESIHAYTSAVSAGERPFVLINSLEKTDFDTVLTYLKGICQGDAVVIIRNIGNDKTLKALWESCRNCAETGMTFSNGKTAIITASEKLPHQNFSLWF